jgi:uncharacterized protein (DUF924 family)
VRDYWFGEPATDTEQLKQKVKRWYMGGEALDREIRQRFAATVDEALLGGLVEWERDIRDRVALVIVLDQFPRSVFRGQAEAFDGDERAQRLVVDALDRGLDAGLPNEYRNFLRMPLVHSEVLALQDRGVAEMQRLYDGAADWERPVYAMGLEQSRKYRDVIARFGRFPHRNPAIGRTSTPDEVDFLSEWKERAAPRGADKL